MTNKVEKFKSICPLTGGNDIREEREQLLKIMRSQKIDELIKWDPNIYGKIYLSGLKKI